ncbi:BMP family ABC transporter substrate-binding protein [Silvanigrella paludirubra]|uniref:BMP family ABC transporter substrate-binding protein n=1 Tax=Silvanigrella paludirubra TaxID=2499159 RepID=A0A6N6VWK9_9BACT|nr:BMP family ABC transporter substrate-binding protein [Silvanigrella paludirubra]KAB8038853.1 BMP family ABC transporter substrate-binding protein [Silvanigrella paludirubra]
MKSIRIFKKSFFLLPTFGILNILSLNSNASTKTELPKICLVLDKGGKDDKSFNQSAYDGFIRAQKELKISKESKYVTVTNDAQSQNFIRSFSNGECGLVIAVGFNNADSVGKVAKKYPNQKYALVDSTIDEPNIRSISFQEHEGSFLVGAIAAMKSKSGNVGFIGGMEIPLIKRFGLGFEAGAKYINPKIKVTETFVGITSAAWNNPTKAKEIALSMYTQGIDVIFVAAGASSQGAFDAVEEANRKFSNKFIIGVDSNQNYIAPGHVLTSMEKKVNLKVFTAIQDFVDNKFTTGVIKYGFADGGIDWSYDNFNKKLFKDSEIKEINRIKKEINDNKIIVPDFYKTSKN